MATVFESSNMASSAFGGRIYDCVAEEVLENGTVGYIEELAEGESHIFKFVKGTKEGLDPIVIDQPVWNPDESRMTNQRRDKFVIPAGTPFRARRIATHDVFAVNKEGFTTGSQSEVKVGAYVTVDAATGKFVAQAAKPGSGSYGVIDRKRVLGETLVTTAHTYGSTVELFEIRIVH